MRLTGSSERFEPDQSLQIQTDQHAKSQVRWCETLGTQSRKDYGRLGRHLQTCRVPGSREERNNCQNVSGPINTCLGSTHSGAAVAQRALSSMLTLGTIRKDTWRLTRLSQGFGLHVREQILPHIVSR